MIFVCIFRERISMNKIQIISLIGALGVAKLLFSKEPEDIKATAVVSCFSENLLEEIPMYTLSMLDIVSESDTLGNTQYYFVNRKYNSIEVDPLNVNDWNYQSITDSKKKFSNLLPIIQESGYYWLPDINYNLSVINAKNFLIANGYDTTKKYSKKELETIEKKFNDFSYNPYLWLKEMTFPINLLRMIGVGDAIFIYDIDFAVQVQENNLNGARNVVYFYNLLDLKRALKCHYGLSLEEEQKLRELNDYSYLDFLYIEKETSLYKECEKVVFTNYELLDFLTEEQINRGYLYYNEISDIVQSCKSNDPQRLLIASR